MGWAATRGARPRWGCDEGAGTRLAPAHGARVPSPAASAPTPGPGGREVRGRAHTVSLRPAPSSPGRFSPGARQGHVAQLGTRRRRGAGLSTEPPLTDAARPLPPSPAPRLVPGRPTASPCSLVSGGGGGRECRAGPLSHQDGQLRGRPGQSAPPRPAASKAGGRSEGQEGVNGTSGVSAMRP